LAVLRKETGEIYSSVKEINFLISPNKIEHFELNKELHDLVAAPLDASSSVAIYQHMPKELENYRQQKKLLLTNAITVWEKSDASVKERLRVSTRPHLSPCDAIFCVLAGAMIFYLQIPQGQFALLLQPGDWIYLVSGSNAWTKLTDDNYCTIVTYSREKTSLPAAEMKYTTTVDKNIL
jgi:cupin superfamily acireductone dioxygenase involved in methionine salvage